MERTYIIPLRKELAKVPPSKKAKRAVTAVKSFLMRHMHADEVGIGAELNEYLWSRGIENPPHKVEVSVKQENGVTFANLVGKSLTAKKVEVKKTEPDKNLLEKQIEKLKGKEPEEKATS